MTIEVAGPEAPRQRTGHRPRSDAFTLIELLSVVVILGIVASLITAAVSSARAKARRVHCMQNLRQHGLALATFVAEHGEYPLAWSTNTEARYRAHGKFWLASLYPERLDERGAFREWPAVDDCPAAPPPSELPRGLGYVDFGYNACGLGGPVMKPLLGIGGAGPGPYMSEEFMEASYAPPVNESEIVNPSELLAIGDGFRGWRGIIEDGSGLGRAPTARDFMGSTARSHRRHRGRANMLFADGHLDALPLTRLFLDETDSALRLWNRDNQPHRERLIP
jgi:prepilin-type processing-associated H-X9-DG protein/prepilin-type N-terminal cleavage/methylation domain-containing protein